MGGTMHKRGTMRLATAIAMAMAVPAPSAGAGIILPPELDYASHCRPSEAAAPPLDRDWTQWPGGALALPVEEVTALAAEYARGSGRVAQSADTALRLLTALDGQIDPHRLDRLIGRILAAPERSAEEQAAGEARLLRAFAGGEGDAALDLAKLYGPNGPRALRDAAKARNFARIAAASGDSNGKLTYAGMMASDPALPAEQKSFLVEAALLAVVGDVLTGDCKNLRTVGMLYLRGDLVPADIATAIAWFKPAAAAGDAITQERLGELISGRLMQANDFELALDYYQAAADQGRPAAAFKVGQDFATGLVRQRDLSKAEHYLSQAAAAGSTDAHVWLARLHHGDFGGVPDLARAKQHYRTALGTGRSDPELAREFGVVLMRQGEGPAERAEARRLLTQAAYAGSGIAAVRLGEMLIEEARTAPALYGDVDTFLRLGDTLGRPEGALRLAQLTRCAGPLYDPAAAVHWVQRAVALGSKKLTLDEAIRLLGSVDPALRAQGQLLLAQVALTGDARGVGTALAQLQAADDQVSDPGLRDELERLVAGKADDPGFMQPFDLAFVAADMDRPGAAERLDAALERVQVWSATGDSDALLLQAELLRTHGGATPVELLPLYQKAAQQGAPKAMRELGNALLADPSADVATARGWLQQAATAGDVKAALRLIDTTAPTALTALAAIGESGTVCSADAMVDVARTYSASIDPAAGPEAAKWLALATEAAGDRATDLVRIATAYRTGVAGADTVGAAEPLLARATQLGSVDAARQLADGHLSGLWPDADPDLGQQLLASLAADGDQAAAVRLLHAIADGAVEAPASRVVALVNQGRDALDDGGKTLARLAELDEAGTFGVPDAARQLGWLEGAAAAGDAAAMMRLYRAYASGIGVPMAPERALAWLEQAADSGDARAARELAAAYTVGFGTLADPQKAAIWRARAQVVTN